MNPAESTLTQTKAKMAGLYRPNSTYDTIANRFVWGFQHDGGTVFLKNHNIPVICSDYALYWFDYKGGYDVVFAQLGWNNNPAQEIALVPWSREFSAQRLGSHNHMEIL